MANEVITPDFLEGMEDDLAGGLLGMLDVENQNALLLGIVEIGKVNPKRGKFLLKKYNKAIKAGDVKAPQSGYPNSRASMIDRLSLLPPEYRNGLAEKRLRLGDQVYYQTKAANAVTGSLKLFQSSDAKGTGTGNVLGNVANAKLDQEKPFLVQAIQILSGTGATVDAATFAIADKAVRNGQFTIRHDGKEIIKEMHAVVFDTTNRQDRQIGMYILDNPFLISPAVEFSLDVDLVGATAANTWVKAALWGTSVNPA